jgi:hypothetical protein
MADIANKYAENISGKCYVDDQRIDCDLCRETAPANFTRIDAAATLMIDAGRACCGGIATSKRAGVVAMESRLIGHGCFKCCAGF